MVTEDQCVALYPYFKIQDGRLDEFQALCKRFVEKTKSEPGCLYYGFTFDGDRAHCREGYVDAEALLNHIQSVGALLEEVLKIANVERLELHGPAEQLEKLRGPLASFNPQHYVLYEGFRNA